jgi:hypothetical protein
MKGLTTFASSWAFFAIVTLLAIWLIALPLQVTAQTNSCSGVQGQNGVYNPTCNNNHTPGVVGSSAFIDASTFGKNTTDICTVLHGILSSNSYPASGAVIDARGLPGNTQTKMTCTTANPSPVHRTMIDWE